MGSDGVVGFAAYWFRATLRSRWRGYVGIVVLLGITGGLSLFALAGARRTQSAYPRFLRDANVSTMAVDTGQYDPETVATIASLPEVERSRVYVAPLVARIAHGKPVFHESFEALASLDGRFFDQDRFTPTSGRLPNPKRVDEVAVNEVAADRFGYRLGQKIVLGTWDPADIGEDFFAEPDSPEAPHDRDHRRHRVVPGGSGAGRHRSLGRWSSSRPRTPARRSPGCSTSGRGSC